MIPDRKHELDVAQSEIGSSLRHMGIALGILETWARLDNEFETNYLLQQAVWWLAAADRKLRQGRHAD